MSFLTGGAILYAVRTAIGESSTTRWTDTALLERASQAQIQVSHEVDHPEATQPIQTTAGIREYQLPLLTKILRVYMVNGTSYQELVGTDIPTLEGDVIESYDNTSGMISGAPTQTPQWLAESGQGYPVASDLTGPGYDSHAPYTSVTASSAQRPMYYLRGGYIGVVPPPSSALKLQVDYIPMPPVLTATGSQSILPYNFLDCIMWKTCTYVFFSDRNMSMMQIATVEYEKALRILRNWVYTLQATKPKMFVPITKRTWVRRMWGW